MKVPELMMAPIPAFSSSNILADRSPARNSPFDAAIDVTFSLRST
jgi:hypothetical protein